LASVSTTLLNWLSLRIIQSCMLPKSTVGLFCSIWYCWLLHLKFSSLDFFPFVSVDLLFPLNNSFTIIFNGFLFSLNFQVSMLSKVFPCPLALLSLQTLWVVLSKCMA
jgi:hypothetical protein